MDYLLTWTDGYLDISIKSSGYLTSQHVWKFVMRLKACSDVFYLIQNNDLDYYLFTFYPFTKKGTLCLPYIDIIPDLTKLQIL